MSGRLALDILYKDKAFYCHPTIVDRLHNDFVPIENRKKHKHKSHKENKLALRPLITQVNIIQKEASARRWARNGRVCEQIYENRTGGPFSDTVK